MQLPFLFTEHVPTVAGPQSGSGTALFSTVHGHVLHSSESVLCPHRTSLTTVVIPSEADVVTTSVCHGKLHGWEMVFVTSCVHFVCVLNVLEKVRQCDSVVLFVCVFVADRMMVECWHFVCVRECVLRPHTSLQKKVLITQTNGSWWQPRVTQCQSCLLHATKHEIVSKHWIGGELARPPPPQNR